MRELTELYYFSPTKSTKKAGILLCEDFLGCRSGRPGKRKKLQGA